MLESLAFWTGFALWGCVAAPAISAVLPVSGTVSIRIPLLGSPELTGTGSGTSVGGGAAGHSAFVLGATEFEPIAPTFLGHGMLSVPAGASLPAATLSGTAAGANGIAGFAFWYGTGGTPLGGIPLHPIGGGGSTLNVVGLLVGTLLGATWMGASGSATPVVFSTLAAALAIPITVTATAYDNRTLGGLGTVQFVAPATFSIGVFGALPMFGVLTLAYTPEPGTLLLLGSGIAGLAALGRQKRRG